MDQHQRAFLVQAFDLGILELDPLVSIVDPECSGDGVPEMLATCLMVVRVERAPGEADNADNHTAATCLFCRCVFDQCWDRIRFSLTGVHPSIHTEQVRVSFDRVI